METIFETHSRAKLISIRLKRLSLLLLVIAAGIPPLKAQSPWEAYPFPNPTLWQLVPYTPPTTTPPAGSLEEAQRQVSKSIALLATATNQGSGYLIRTDPTKPHVCMLSAGHVIRDLIASLRTGTLPMYLAFNYVRRGEENYATDLLGDPTHLPANGMNNLSADWVNNVPVEVAGWQEEGAVDWALLKIPKLSFPLGAQVNQLPVSFATSITANLTTDLFSIHHGKGYPQRLSLLPKNQYTAFEGLYGGAWRTKFWSIGGSAGGSSGAPLIQYTVGGEVAAVGILIVGVSYPYNPSYYRNLPSSLRNNAEDDYSSWVIDFFKVSNIRDEIETHCGPQSQTVSVTTVTPHPIPAATGDADFTDDAALKATSATTVLADVGTASILTTLGSLSLRGFELSGRHVFLSAQKGDVNLGEGFSIQADATTSLQLGLMGSIAGRLPAARQGAPSPVIPPSEDQRFVLYPNPAHDQLTIQPADREQAYQVRIMDILGHTVWQETEFRAGVRQLDLPGKALPAGSYLFQIQPQQGTLFSTHVVIQ